MDDEPAKDVGAFQTLVELRADVHTRLQKMLHDRAETAIAEQIVEKLNEKNPIDIPPSLVEQQCRMMEMEILQTARRAGQKPTQEQFATVHAQVHAEAEKRCAQAFLMAAIAKKLDIQVGDADLQKGLEELAAETGKNFAKVRAEYGDPQRRQMLVGMILEDKVLDAIETNEKDVPESKRSGPSGTRGRLREPRSETASAEPASKAKRDQGDEGSEGKRRRRSLERGLNRLTTAASGRRLVGSGRTSRAAGLSSGNNARGNDDEAS